MGFFGRLRGRISGGSESEKKKGFDSELIKNNNTVSAKVDDQLSFEGVEMNAYDKMTELFGMCAEINKNVDLDVCVKRMDEMSRAEFNSIIQTKFKFVLVSNNASENFGSVDIAGWGDFQKRFFGGVEEINLGDDAYKRHFWENLFYEVVANLNTLNGDIDPRLAEGGSQRGALLARLYEAFMK